jgi:hypothetical protein
LPGDLIFGVVMIAMLMALAIWGVGRVVSLRDEQAQAAAHCAFDCGCAGRSAPRFARIDLNCAAGRSFAGHSRRGEAPLALEPQAAFTNANVTVSVFALERVFVRISVDGEVVFEGRMAPRETKVFEAHDQVVVLTGNGRL